MAFLSALI